MRELIVKITYANPDASGEVYAFDVVTEDGSFKTSIPLNAHTKMLLGSAKKAYYKIVVEDNGSFRVVYPKLKGYDF
jgi:hypothetical protein